MKCQDCEKCKYCEIKNRPFHYVGERRTTKGWPRHWCLKYKNDCHQIKNCNFFKEELK